MRIPGTSALRTVAVCLVAGIATVGAARPADAEILRGLSLRVGSYFTSEGAARQRAGAWAGGIGLEYAIPWMPHVFSGEGWTTSISADAYYRKGMGISDEEGTAVAFRYFPVAINQVYNFEEQSGGATPYLGFCLTAATYGASGNGRILRQPTVTRFGGGLVVGVNFRHSLYLEGRYEKIKAGGGDHFTPDGFRATLGYRF